MKDKFPCEIKLSEAEPGHVVQYGWLRGRDKAIPLTGVVCYPELEEPGKRKIRVMRHNRMGFVVLDANWEVINFGFQNEEKQPPYKGPVPGIS